MVSTKRQDRSALGFRFRANGPLQLLQGVHRMQGRHQGVVESRHALGGDMTVLEPVPHVLQQAFGPVQVDLDVGRHQPADAHPFFLPRKAHQGGQDALRPLAPIRRGCGALDLHQPGGPFVHRLDGREFIDQGRQPAIGCQQLIETDQVFVCPDRRQDAQRPLPVHQRSENEPRRRVESTRVVDQQRRKHPAVVRQFQLRGGKVPLEDLLQRVRDVHFRPVAHAVAHHLDRKQLASAEHLPQALQQVGQRHGLGMVVDHPCAKQQEFMDHRLVLRRQVQHQSRDVGQHVGGGPILTGVGDQHAPEGHLRAGIQGIEPGRVGGPGTPDGGRCCLQGA
jgi:hypothetical protein